MYINIVNKIESIQLDFVVNMFFMQSLTIHIHIYRYFMNRNWLMMVDFSI